MDALSCPLNPTADLCQHCGDIIPLHHASREFCCSGCRSVYGLLQEKGLGGFYKLLESHPQKVRRPALESTESYAYLDDPAFLEEYAGHSNARTLDFYLEGIQCAACLWLIEKLPDWVPSVTHSRLNMADSVVRLEIRPGAKFSEPARELARLGYLPHALKKNESSELLKKKENRSWLLRIGVAAACSGNIMLLAFSQYAGAPKSFSQVFGILSALLYLPVGIYSAFPFYRSALASIKSKKISIDVPIVFALTLGASMSFWNVLTGNPEHYLDSLSAFIFLLLSSRYFLRRLQQTGASNGSLTSLLTPSRAKVWQDSKWIEVSARSLKAGNLIRVGTAEPIPADGKIIAGKSFINCALLTGESQPKLQGIGDIVYSGTVNEGESIDIEVLIPGNDTRLSKLLKTAEEELLHRSPAIEIADRAAKWFLLGVFVLAIGAFFYAGDTTEGLSRALSLLIVTCPCALALATPLTLSVTLKRAAREGIIIRSGTLLDSLVHAKNIFIDKTGTLTKGRLEVTETKWIPLENHERREMFEKIRSLEENSPHPVAHALRRWIDTELTAPTSVLNVQSRVLLPGVGISAQIKDDWISVQRLETPEWLSDQKIGTTFVAIYHQWAGASTWHKIAEFALGDRLRTEAPVALNKLKKLGLNPWILSGDRQETVQMIASALKIPKDQALSGLSPEAKKECLIQHPNSIMVGDGANDASALAYTQNSIAVQGSMEASLRAASAYSTRPGLDPVVCLIELAYENKRTLYRGYILSITYNLIAATAAFMGVVSPLIAAIIMPLSALTVFTSSHWRPSRGASWKS